MAIADPWRRPCNHVADSRPGHDITPASLHLRGLSAVSSRPLHLWPPRLWLSQRRAPHFPLASHASLSTKPLAKPLTIRATAPPPSYPWPPPIIIKVLQHPYQSARNFTVGQHPEQSGRPQGGFSPWTNPQPRRREPPRSARDARPIAPYARPPLTPRMSAFPSRLRPPGCCVRRADARTRKSVSSPAPHRNDSRLRSGSHSIV
jgi:hypothetical protein